jgi:hypothetical protein
MRSQVVKCPWWSIRAWFAVVAALATGAASACAFPNYNLPIPFQMYAIGATAALALSFALVGYVVRARPAWESNATAIAVGGRPFMTASTARSLLSVLNMVSVGGLVLAIATGFYGSPIPIANFNITFFFIVFVLGFAYATALIGDVYQLVNPWQAVCQWIEYRTPGAFRGQTTYPRWLAYYPALLLYMAYIWIELFANIAPRDLSLVLVGYSALNIAGAWLFGRQAWFEHGEFLSVFFRMIGKMAPVKYIKGAPDGGGFRVEFRMPFVGLIRAPATQFSLLLFVLFMLSSTAVDGAHATLPWVDLFWKGIYPLLNGVAASAHEQWLFSVQAYYGWQWLMLFISPFAYLLVYVGFIYAAKVFAGSDQPLGSLILQFAFTLIPIAFVYNVTHYFTLLLGQGYQVGRMLSDPFNRGWNLFGTASWGGDPLIPDASVVWHVQVGLILLGHIVSVYLAHVEALKTFATSRKALVSQLPMLVLMMVFTTTGLWILSLPISAGQPADSAAVSASVPVR